MDKMGKGKEGTLVFFFLKKHLSRTKKDLCLSRVAITAQSDY